MRKRNLVEEEIREEERIVENLKEELAGHEKVLEPKILPLKNKISELRTEQLKTESPKPSPLFIAAAIAFAAIAVLNWLVFKWSSVITIAAVVLALIVWIARSIVTKVISRPFKKAQKKTDNEVMAINGQISDIKATDPEIGKLESQINDHEVKIIKLEDELKEVEIAEKIGTNNLIVSLNNKGAFYFYIDENAKFQSVNYYTLYLNVDGKDWGSVNNPCTIIPLSPGIHSVTAEFIPASNDATFTMQKIQFSLNDDNNYISFKKPYYDLKNKKKVFTVDKSMSRDRAEFLAHSEISELDFEKYIYSL